MTEAILTGINFGPRPLAPSTHDYTRRYWGHDYVWKPDPGGATGTLMGWGRGIHAGDYLLLQDGTGSTRYQIDTIQYYRDPADMWAARATFAPRPKLEDPQDE